MLLRFTLLSLIGTDVEDVAEVESLMEILFSLSDVSEPFAFSSVALLVNLSPTLSLVDSYEILYVYSTLKCLPSGNVSPSCGFSMCSTFLWNTYLPETKCPPPCIYHAPNCKYPNSTSFVTGISVKLQSPFPSKTSCPKPVVLPSIVSILVP